MNNIDKYKAELQKEQERLLREIEEKSKTEDFGSDVDSFDEETDEAEETANRLAIAETLKNRAKEIGDALNRIESGSYGKCTECGGVIGEDVLDLSPESGLCTDCKKKQN